ncbi:methyltransferase, partial [Fusarium globosum]
KVIGVDTTPVQPNVIPPNLVFEIEDVEDDCLWGEGTFDLIHGRELIMAIRNWPRLMEQAFNHLKPGAYFQLSGSVPDFKSDDGTLPPDSAYFEMSQRIGCSGWEPTRWKEHLENAGFEDVVERVLEIPTNPWPKDKHLKEIEAFELSHFRDTIGNVFARGYEQILNGDPNYFQVLLAKARKEVLNPKCTVGCPYQPPHQKSASPDA